MNGSLGGPGSAGSWLIRKRSGRIYSCGNRETLLRWISEGRVNRDDEISERGERWFRLGDAPDLHSIFSRREGARGLGDRRVLRPRPVRSARDIGLSDDESERMVDKFRRRRAVRNVAVGVTGTALVIGAIGYSVAFAGPEGNPVRSFAIQNGLLPGYESASRAVDDSLLLAARALERGDLADLQQAETIYAKAMMLRPNDGALAADRMLALSAYSISLSRLAADEQRDAAKSTDEKEQKRLTKMAEDRRSKAYEALSGAAALRATVEKAPDTLAAHRALAEYHRAIGDLAKQQQHLARALSYMESGGKKDAWTLVVEAESLAPDPDRAIGADLTGARGRLEEALGLNPQLAVARLHLARMLIAGGDNGRAEEELRVVLRDHPSNEEAQRLLGRIGANEHAEDVATAPSAQKAAGEDTSRPG